jgi:hypothetical protein
MKLNKTQPITRPSQADKCLQRVIEGDYEGDLWEVMEVLFQESDQAIYEKVIRESLQALRKVEENRYARFTGGSHIDNFQEVFRGIKKSYQNITLIKDTYEEGTRERVNLNKIYLKIQAVDEEMIKEFQGRCLIEAMRLDMASGLSGQGVIKSLDEYKKLKKDRDKKGG